MHVTSKIDEFASYGVQPARRAGTNASTLYYNPELLVKQQQCKKALEIHQQADFKKVETKKKLIQPTHVPTMHCI